MRQEEVAQQRAGGWWQTDRGRGGARHRPTVAVVDLEAVRHNVRTLAAEGARFMAVVKANGYGHGDVPVARAALQAGAAWLGVALVEEGVRLRDAGIDAPILVLTQFPPGSEREALAAGLTPTAYTEAGVVRLAEAARATGTTPGVHVKIDTGMHRVGVSPERAPQLLEGLRAAGLRLEGLWTHLAKSEELDDEFTAAQLARFMESVSTLRAMGFRPRHLHAANTAAAMACPEARLDLVRVGLGTYGLCPGSQLAGLCDLRPALSWVSRVALVKRIRSGEGVSYGLRYHAPRDTTIATVPVGYADGYSRRLTNRGQVLIRGRRHPIAGTVTMDQVMVDCGDDPVAEGDEVVLIGRQGGDEITSVEVAEWTDTIPYEVVCALSERVPREYVGER